MMARLGKLHKRSSELQDGPDTVAHCRWHEAGLAADIPDPARQLGQAAFHRIVLGGSLVEHWQVEYRIIEFPEPALQRSSHRFIRDVLSNVGEHRLLCGHRCESSEDLIS